MDEAQLRRIRTHEHGGEPGAQAAAAGVNFLRSGHSMT